MHDEAAYGERLLAMGVRGYVMKQEASQVILTALRKVIAGSRRQRRPGGTTRRAHDPHGDASQPADALMSGKPGAQADRPRPSTQDIAVALA